MTELALTITGQPPHSRADRSENCETRLLSDQAGLGAVGFGSSRSRAKRVLDLTLALAGLPVLALVGLVVVPVIRLNSGGPAVFAQTRVGRHGEPIKIFKFRTLTTGNPEVPTHELSPSAVTGVGRVLRATKLDELPQLINVLQGNMSFVGPRPCLPSQLDVLAEREAAGVVGLLPGISGWAQLAGVDMQTPVLLAAIERDYLLHSTLADDVRAVVATLPGPIRLGRDFEHLRLGA